MQDLTTLFNEILADMPDEIETEQLSFHDFAVRQCEWYNESEGGLNEMDCPECKNRGYFQTLDEDDNKIMKECRCMAARRYIRAMMVAGLGDLYKKCTFEAYEVTEEWQKVCKETALKYAKQDGDGWFFFAGNSGSGKTHLCTAICSSLAKRGRQIMYVQWVRLYEKLVQTRFKETEQEAIFSGIEKADVLYLDDFLKTPRNVPPKEDMLSYALEIVDARYKAGKKTIFSSEFPLSQISSFDEALGGRLYEMTKEYQTYTGNDKRRNYRTKGE